MSVGSLHNFLQHNQQEIDDGRRGRGYVYGALWETTGDGWTQCYPQRAKKYFIDFLCFVDSQVPAEMERIYAIMDKSCDASFQRFVALHAYP